MKATTAGKDVSQEIINRFSQEMSFYYSELKSLDTGSREIQVILDRIMDFWESVEIDWDALMVKREDIENDIIEYIESNLHVQDLKIVGMITNYFEYTNRIDIIEMKKTKRFMESLLELFRLLTSDRDKGIEIDEAMENVQNEKKPEKKLEMKTIERTKMIEDRKKTLDKLSEGVTKYLKLKEKGFDENVRLECAMIKEELKKLPYKSIITKLFKKHTGDEL